MKKTLKIIITSVILVAIIGFIITFTIIKHKQGKTIFNETLVYGNSAGNYYNGGLFCEANGYIYFSNPLDEYKLYYMTPMGENPKKLSNDSVCFINADPHYIYYARNGQSKSSNFSFLHFNTNSLCRIPVSGGETFILDEAPALYVTLIQNALYYIHYDDESASTLYKIKIDGSDARKISNDPLLLSPGQEGTLCYAGVSHDQNISLWDPLTDTNATVYNGSCYNPIDTDKYIYYMDITNDYHIMRCNKESGELIDLTSCRVDCYNLTEDYLYYQKNQEGEMALCRIRLDGSGTEEIVKEGTFCNIHATSEYVFFASFRSENEYFYTPSNGPVQVQRFEFVSN